MDSPALAEKPRASMLVSHGTVWPSPTNPRTRFDDDRLKELAASMTPAVGIIEPLVVRPHPTKPHQFEIVAGERRWRAAKIAGLMDVPVIVRELTDAQVLDLQLIENKHRDDIHPLEEARALERRIKLDRQLTTKGMAKLIGVSERYVQNRLRYLTLIPDAQKAFLDGEFTAGHADILIRLSADDQKLAVKDGLYSEMFDVGDGYGEDLKDGNKIARRLRSVREFDEWTKENIRFKPEEAAASGLFPELAAAIAPRPVPGAESVSGAPVLLQVLDAYSYDPPKGEKPPFPLVRDAWKEVKKGEKCDRAQRAVVVMGHDQGRLLSVCVAKTTCKVHWPHSSSSSSGSSYKPYKPTAAELKRDAGVRRANELRARKQAQWNKVKPLALAAMKKAAATVTTKRALEILSRHVYQLRGASSLADCVLKVAKDRSYDVGVSTKIAKALGVNLAPMFKAAAAPKKATPAKKAAPKKGGKKR